MIKMIADIRFDRPIDETKHFISPGGFTMYVDNEVYEFDFRNSIASIDEEDSTILHCEFSDVDVEEFPNALEFFNKCDKLEELLEFFIYTGEPDDPEINPLELLHLEFYTDKLGVVIVPKDLYIKPINGMIPEEKCYLVTIPSTKFRGTQICCDKEQDKWEDFKPTHYIGVVCACSEESALEICEEEYGYSKDLLNVVDLATVNPL